MGWIVLIIVIGVVLGIIMIRNKIVRYHNAAIRSWSDVASFERQKVQILDQLEPLVERYSNFERGTLERVTELRQSILNLQLDHTDISQLQHIESLNQELMKQLNVVIENYPELKADQIYLKMMQEIEAQNENVGASITIYNRNVELFNSYIQMFPHHLINTATVAKKSIRPFRDPVISENFGYRPNF